MKNGRTHRFGFGVAALAALFAIALPAAAASGDRNKDGIPDRWEKRHGLSLTKNQAKLDQDRDGLVNRAEWRAKTNPRKWDTDGDGLPDGREGNPLDRGVADLSGGFASVTEWDPEAGQLLITVNSGGSVAGRVTGDTAIRCSGSPEDPAEGEDPDTRRKPSQLPNGQGGNLPGRPPRPGPPGGFVPGWGPSVPCSVDDLAVGVSVEMVQIRFSTDGIVFKKVLLDKPVEAPIEDPIEEPPAG